MATEVQSAPGSHIDGWMTDKELCWLRDTAKDMQSVVEIGSFKGRSTFALCASGCAKVYAVDKFQDGEVFKVFQQNVDGLANLVVAPFASEHASRLIPDVDMVFIDGAHDYESVKRDIELWLPKTKRLICGHDFYGDGKTWPGVRQAVLERFPASALTVSESIWSVEVKPLETTTETPASVNGDVKKGIKTIGICAPGETFSAAWVGHLYELWTHALAAGYGLGLFQSFCCYIHITRQNLMRAVFECQHPVDYVLWIDHDNLVTWPQVERLMAALEAHPDSIVSGWYYVAGPDGSMLRTVVGKWHEERQGFTLLKRPEFGDDLFEADACGFGCILMRPETMKTLGLGAFISPDGRYGEDFAFCVAAKKAGIKLFVDPQVEVPHLKLRAIVPTA